MLDKNARKLWKGSGEMQLAQNANAVELILFIYYGGIPANRQPTTPTNQNLDPVFLFDFFTHQRPILHHFGAVHISYRRMDGRCSRISLCQNVACRLKSLADQLRTTKKFGAPFVSPCETRRHSSHSDCRI